MACPLASSNKDAMSPITTVNTSPAKEQHRLALASLHPSLGWGANSPLLFKWSENDDTYSTKVINVAKKKQQQASKGLGRSCAVDQANNGAQARMPKTSLAVRKLVVKRPVSHSATRRSPLHVLPRTRNSRRGWRTYASHASWCRMDATDLPRTLARTTEETMMMVDVMTRMELLRATKLGKGKNLVNESHNYFHSNQRIVVNLQCATRN